MRGEVMIYEINKLPTTIAKLRSTSTENKNKLHLMYNLNPAQYFYLIKDCKRLDLIDRFLAQPDITPAKVVGLANITGHDPKYAEVFIKRKKWHDCIYYAEHVYQDPKIIEAIAKPGCRYKFKYLYCRDVEDLEIMWRALAVPNPKAYRWQVEYCRYVKDREEMWKVLATNTHNPEPLYAYCLSVNDREEIWKALAKSTDINAPTFQYFYCINVTDREEIWRALASCSEEHCAYWQYLYYTQVKPRREMWKAIISNPHPEAKTWRNRLLRGE